MKKEKYFQFSLSGLNISFEDIELTSQVPEGMPSFKDFLHNEMNVLNERSEIKGGYVVLPASSDKENIYVNDQTFNVGKQIAHFFKNMSEVAFFVCTAGNAVSARTNQLNEKGDIVEAYLVDVLGSIMVEKAMDAIQNILIEDYQILGLGVSNRYSPGYCSWNVKEQQQLFSFFSKGFCNVSLNESCLMNPTKSVSGMIAIGKKVEFHQHVCHSCNSTNCLYRNKNNNTKDYSLTH